MNDTNLGVLRLNMAGVLLAPESVVCCSCSLAESAAGGQQRDDDVISGRSVLSSRPSSASLRAIEFGNSSWSAIPCNALVL